MNPESHVDTTAAGWLDAVRELKLGARRFRPEPHPRVGGPRSEIRFDDGQILMSLDLHISRALTLPADPAEHHETYALEWWDEAQFAAFRRSKQNRVFDRINEGFERAMYEEREEGSLEVVIAWLICDEVKFELDEWLCLASTAYCEDPEALDELVEGVANEILGPL